MSVSIAVERTRSPKGRPSEDKLGFGKVFTDHMFQMNHDAARGWHSARVVPYQPLALDPSASVLHYGQAIFEGMKAFRGTDGKVRLFRPEMNWQRMQASAERLCMKFLDRDTFLESLMSLVRADKDWVPKLPGTSLYLRPTLIGTEAFLGVRPSDEYNFFVIASPVGNYYGEGSEALKIWVEREYSRAAPGGIGAAKAGGNYASSLAAALAAKEHGFAQVLWLDACEKRFIEEVGTMNVFFRIRDKVVTPALSGTILPGVTRDSVLELLRHWGRAVEERPVELAEIVAAQARGDLAEIFGTGTAASISPVGALGVGEKTLIVNGGKPGALALELHRALNDIQYGRAPDKLGWMREVR